MAEPAAAQRVELPEPVGYVNDFADVIPENVEASIRNVVDEVRAKSGGEIVVVTLSTLPGGRSRDEVALEIGRQWRIGPAGEAGDQARNTGAVVLVVPKETSADGQGHVKLELGDRTNTFITATEAGRIRDRVMIPAFREGDYGGGILVGVVALAEMYAEHFDFELTGDYPRDDRGPVGGGGGPSLFTIILLILLFLGISRIFRGGGGGRGFRRGRRRGMPLILPIPFPLGGGRRGGFGGFGGGGGFGGFGGGGGFSGGGAGGSW
ncbi:MAG TPA: TPM domain-containing protein [Longimicrobiales bacterium]|nr:TPM domain-containing protein [Longimicrobiales bacterium]